MPGPPTPLSGCPLKRFEIHDRSASRVYDAAQLANSLTLTLEAQRSVNADSHDLVLQVHCGLQRVLSIKLADLLKSPHDKTETLSIERASQKLCVKVNQQGQTILANFDEVRDFNVAVCMLKKFGFQVKDGISFLSFINASGHPASPSYTILPRTNFGPRLSSITPLSGPDSQLDSEIQQAFSFTSMLNSDLMPTQSDHVYHHFHPPPQTMQNQFVQAPLSQNLSMPLTQQASPPHLNPYNMFLGNQNNRFHQPRVSSPLRNSFEADAPITTPFLNFGRPVQPGQPATGTLQGHRSISAPIVPSDSQRQGFNNLNAYFQEPSDMQAQSEDPQSSAFEHVSQGQNATQEKPPSEPARNFRELMPQPRNLPFTLREKAADRIMTSKTIQKDAKPALTNKHKASTRPSKERQTRSKTGCKNNGTAHAMANEDFRQKTPTKSSVDISDAECQTQSPAAASRLADLSRVSPATMEVPTMLIADPALLRQASEATSRFLEQYKADVARGCDDAGSAQFYVEQIHTARTNFWIAQLIDIECGRRPASSV